MGAFKNFLLEDEIKKSKAEAEGLTIKAFGHAKDAAGHPYEWNDETKNWDRIIDSQTKEQILKKMKALGFEHSSYKQYKKDRDFFKDKGFASRRTSATTPAIEKLKSLPEKGRKYIINQRGDNYTIVAWARAEKD